MKQDPPPESAICLGGDVDEKLFTQSILNAFPKYSKDVSAMNDFFLQLSQAIASPRVLFPASEILVGAFLQILKDVVEVQDGLMTTVKNFFVLVVANKASSLGKDVSVTIRNLQHVKYRFRGGGSPSPKELDLLARTLKIVHGRVNLFEFTDAQKHTLLRHNLVVWSRHGKTLELAYTLLGLLVPLEEDDVPRSLMVTMCDYILTKRLVNYNLPLTSAQQMQCFHIFETYVRLVFEDHFPQGPDVDLYISKRRSWENRLRTIVPHVQQKLKEQTVHLWPVIRTINSVNQKAK